MRAREFLFEKKSPDPLRPLKAKVISQVKQTSDKDLLDKVYSALNSTNFNRRIITALSRDEDLSKFVDEVANIITSMPGDFDEKMAFIEELPKGYVDIEKMLSGKRVTFTKLLRTNSDKVSKKFVINVFLALKSVGERMQKGPGEFALAALSPEISIFGSGDLKIKDQVIEVKANKGQEASSGGGRLGHPGDLQFIDIPNIISKYLPAFDVNQSLSLVKFRNVLDTSGLDNDTIKDFATELFSYIFKAQLEWTDISPLVDAALTPGQTLVKPYIKVAYDAYRGPSGQTKFDGVMLMNFPLQQLRYYEDPEELFKDIYSTSPSLIDPKNISLMGRQILPQVTLKPSLAPNFDMPEENEEIDEETASDLAEFMLASQKINDPELIEKVAVFIKDNWGKKLNMENVSREIFANFPELSQMRYAPPKKAPTKKKPAAQQPAAQPPAAQQPAAQQPSVAPTEPAPSQNL